MRRRPRAKKYKERQPTLNVDSLGSPTRSQTPHANGFNDWETNSYILNFKEELPAFRVRIFDVFCPALLAIAASCLKERNRCPVSQEFPIIILKKKLYHQYFATYWNMNSLISSDQKSPLNLERAESADSQWAAAKLELTHAKIRVRARKFIHHVQLWDAVVLQAKQKRNQVSNACPVHAADTCNSMSFVKAHAGSWTWRIPLYAFFFTKISSSCPENVFNIFFTKFIQVFVKFVQNIETVSQGWGWVAA